MRLFALGYLSPQEVDALQLVDRRFCTTVETHRHYHLARYTVAINYSTYCTPPLRIIPDGVDASRAIIYDRIWQDDKEAIALRLDGLRVGCVRKLEFDGDVPPGAEQELIACLQKEQIPIQLALIWDDRTASTERLTAAINSQLRVEKLEVKEEEGDISLGLFD